VAVCTADLNLRVLPCLPEEREPFFFGHLGDGLWRLDGDEELPAALDLVLCHRRDLLLGSQRLWSTRPISG